ncbi:response regulator [Parvularcula sp. ZS-1/3]|uniref:histidine kinase n=1 Tax=Parvularcula mediterranea TaxID=2732508 RepID=A0A7Y3RJX3_9PROT|nr:ATP-binding protein [Parvularcula mediterranea]NNU15439.1 response regulator [Parvularcula mediterranea]
MVLAGTIGRLSQLERWLKIDPEASPVVATRARAVYVVALVLALLQFLNVGNLVWSYGYWSPDAAIALGGGIFLTISIFALRWTKNFRIFALAYTGLSIACVTASALQFYTGINTALLPMICLGPIIIGYIHTWRAAVLYGVLGAGLLLFYFWWAMFDPRLVEYGWQVWNVQRLMQSELAMILSTVVGVNFSYNSYSALEKQQAHLEQVSRAEAAKSQFLATMSHELRTPLNGVIGMAEVLTTSDLKPRERELADTIRRSGQSLLVIIGDLLDLSKIEAGKMEIETEPFSVRDLISHAVGIWAGPAALKNTDLIQRIDEKARDTVLGDEHRIGQILHNLISNAVKFTDSGTVTVSLEVEDGPLPTYRFRVEDTGKGVPDDVADQIFEAFEQGESGTTRRYGGTGLGLPICRLLSELMGGSIALERSNDRGSCFCLSLPLRPASAATPVRDEIEEVADVSSLQGLRVLVAEDNQVNRMVMREYLKTWGTSFVFAHDGPSALEALDVERFDLLLLDKHMPGMSGYEVAEAVRASGGAHASMPIIAVSADTLAGEEERALAAGMDGYVAKPVRPAQLSAKIIDVLAARSASATEGANNA